MKKIVIDTGHIIGANPSPSTITKYSEGTTMYQMGVQLQNILYRDFDGHTTELTRLDPTVDMLLETRGHKAKGASLFISLHSDAHLNNRTTDADGVTCIIPLTASRTFTAWARQVLKAISYTLDLDPNTRATPILQREHPTITGADYYGVIRGAVSVGCRNAMLIEHGFHTNETTVAKLADPNTIYRLAYTHSRAIAERLQLPKKNPQTGL